MSATGNAEAVQSLLRKLAGAAKSSDASAGPEPPDDPIEVMVHSILLWETTTAKADLALKRILSAVVDFNELRVTLTGDIALILGERYPRVRERAARLRHALHDVYQREHAVSLTGLIAVPKRDARRYLDSIDGMPPFAAARTLLLGLGGHSAPVDERLCELLVSHNILEEKIEPERASAVLERHIKAADGVRAHQLLQAWSDGAIRLPAGGRSTRHAAARAKTSTRKRTRKSA